MNATKINATKEKKTLSQWLDQEHVAGVVCTMPFILGFLFFMVVPMALCCYYSLCDYNILSPATFTGLDNYVELFTDDDTFWQTLRVTFFYAFTSVPLRLIFALIVALILVKPSKLSALYRAVYYLPSIIGGSVAVAVLWKRMFAIDGVVNMLLRGIGIDSSFAWLGNSKTAIWTLVLLAVWQFGSSMLIFLASLKQIPRSLYEAAEVDGAHRFRQFWSITFPLLTPTIFFNLVMQTINGFLAFTQCLIITGGAPMNTTLFYAVYMYQQSFNFFHAGYAAAMAWVMLAIIGLITGLLFATKKLWVYEGGL